MELVESKDPGEYPTYEDRIEMENGVLMMLCKVLDEWRESTELPIVDCKVEGVLTSAIFYETPDGAIPLVTLMTPKLGNIIKPIQIEGTPEGG